MVEGPDVVESAGVAFEAGVSAQADPEAAWTRAEVARRLLGRDSAPTRIGRFVVLGVAGKGAMGQVFSAYDERLDRRVAVKLLWGREDDAARARVLREAQALARISHPNVVQVYEVATHRDTPVIAMEYLDGETLRSWQENAGRQPHEILVAYRDAGRGIWAAHQESLVHRDFKPENVLVEQRHDAVRVKVLDFGLALDGVMPSQETGDDELSGEEGLTRTGALVGTPMYMAPEQLRGEPATTASDQFAFCVALAEALWGQHPFGGTTLEALRSAQQRGPTLPQRGRVPTWVRSVLRRGLQFDASDRFPTMVALLDALGWDPGRRRRQGAVALTGVGVVALAGIGWGRNMDRSVPCAGAAVAIAPTWSAPRREAIERAFGALPDGHAPDTAARVVERVDAFASAWVDGHTMACEAASVRGEQSFETMDRRMLCLERVRRSFDDTLAVLETQTAEVLDYADDVLQELPELSRCADLEWVLDMEQPVPPGARSAVSETRRLLVEAEAMRLAGKGELALEKAREAQEAARTVVYGPLEVDVDLVLGRALVETGAYEDARAVLAGAHRAVVRGGPSEQARDVVADRFSLEVAHGVPGAADVLLPGLEGGSVEADDAADLQVRRADMLHRQGKLEEAIEVYRDAVQGFEAIDAPLDVLRGRQGLARALAEHAQFDEAIVQAQEVVAGFEEQVGALHPRTATALHFLADIFRQAGQPKRAESEALRALQTMEAVRPPGHPGIGNVRLTYGGALFAAGDHAQAVDVMREAATELEAALGPEHLALASAYNNLGAVLAALERDSESLEALTRATAINRATLGDAHPQTLRSRDSVASLMRRVGKLDEAEREHRAALEARLELYGPSHPEVAVSHAHIGALLQARGDLEGAASSFQLAVDVGSATAGADSPSVAHNLVSLGGVLIQLGREADAIPGLRKALQIRRAHLDPKSDYLLDSLNVLGTALCEEGAHAQGRSFLEESLALGETVEGIASVRYDAAFSLAKCALASNDRARASAASEVALTWAAKDAGAVEFATDVRRWREGHRFATVP